MISCHDNAAADQRSLSVAIIVPPLDIVDRQKEQTQARHRARRGGDSRLPSAATGGPRSQRASRPRMLPYPALTGLAADASASPHGEKGAAGGGRTSVFMCVS
ncbi:transmembrane protein 267 isoform X2 [Balearica regulorum gibbericeps]|uniref:transmembrane protein 267 isoform X2 n=1 Tax=Balearica regulorum gibbericeps TaxID=100784 RepID=UPI003F5EC2B1